MDKEMIEIEKSAKELAEKNEQIRKEAQKLMGKWSLISVCGEIIESHSVAYTNDHGLEFKLVTGSSEIVADLDGDEVEVSSDDPWTETISTMELCAFLGQFRILAGEIKERMEEKILKSDEALNCIASFLSD